MNTYTNSCLLCSYVDVDVRCTYVCDYIFIVLYFTSFVHATRQGSSESEHVDQVFLSNRLKLKQLVDNFRQSGDYQQVAHELETFVAEQQSQVQVSKGANGDLFVHVSRYSVTEQTTE